MAALRCWHRSCKRVPALQRVSRGLGIHQLLLHLPPGLPNGADVRTAVENGSAWQHLRYGTAGGRHSRRQQPMQALHYAQHARLRAAWRRGGLVAAGTHLHRAGLRESSRGVARLDQIAAQSHGQVQVKQTQMIRLGTVNADATAKMWAAQQDVFNHREFQAAVRVGANVTARDSSGRTALHRLARMGTAAHQPFAHDTPAGAARRVLQYEAST